MCRRFFIAYLFLTNTYNPTRANIPKTPRAPLPKLWVRSSRVSVAGFVGNGVDVGRGGAVNVAVGVGSAPGSGVDVGVTGVGVLVSIGE